MDFIFRAIHRMWPVIFMAFMLPVIVHSESPDRDRLSAVPRFAMVQGTENGDAACFLSLSDESGKPFHARADFAICTQQPALSGHWVALNWRMTRIMAGSCEGNPDCRQTERVALVTQARIVPGKPTAIAAKAANGSLCQPDETVIFDCPVGSKRVSVCASADATTRKGFLQYRFGRPGTPELLLPEAREPDSGIISGGAETYSGGGAAWLRFMRGSTAYVVYTGVGKWGPKGEPRARAGVAVEASAGPTRDIPCTEEETSILGQDWFNRSGITRKTAKETFYIPHN